MSRIADVLRAVLCKKRIQEKQIPWRTATVEKQNVTCFHLSTNPLLAFETEGKQYFFRECPKKQNRETYIQQQIDRFFAYIHNNQLDKINFLQALPIRINFRETEVAAFHAYVHPLQKDNAFLAKLGNVYHLLQSNGYSIWSRDNRVSDALFAQAGLVDVPQELYDIGVYFLWYMRGAMATLESQKSVSGETRYYYNAVRTMATEEVAKALNVGALITPSWWCRLLIDGEERFGIASESAPGIRALDTDVTPTGLLQRDLICLNILDAICFQQDHGPNNYNVDLSCACTVCAFDNDNPNTFFPIGKISLPLSGCSPLVKADGRWNRPYMDRELADALQCICKRTLATNLRPYLNRLQRNSLVSRIKQLQTLVSQANCLQADRWNEETLQQELSGHYGKTYLCSFTQRDS